MRSVVLGKSGLAVSAVGFGGIPIMRVSESDAVRAVRTALDLGVTFIDTAAGYGDSQKKIGLAIKGRRDGLVLATKSGAKTKDAILADVDRARSRMGTDVIDLYQFHGVSSPDAWEQITAADGALGGLIEAREKGMISHVGFSSHNADVALKLADEPVFETVQFPFNLVTREPAEKLIPRARANGLGFIVMKPLCGGQYEDANLAFKFLNAYPDLVPIPGIERPAEIEEIVGVVDSGDVLAGEEKEQAEKIAADLGKLFCRRCGYCQPCPEGLPVQTGMIFESLTRRLPPESVIGAAKKLVEKAEDCAECAECETKCPYDLPIIETVKRAADLAREIINQ